MNPDETFLGLSALQWAALQGIGSLLGFAALVGLTIQLVASHRTTKHQVYSTLNEDYVSFVERCAAHPTSRAHDLYPNQVTYFTHRHELGEEAAVQELLHFSLLFSLWEHAYLDRQRGWMEDSQWVGWHDWMVEYLSRPHALDAWFISARTYDEHFLQYVADHVIRPILGISSQDIPEDSTVPPRPWPTGFDGNADARQRRKRLLAPPQRSDSDQILPKVDVPGVAAVPVAATAATAASTEAA